MKTDLNYCIVLSSEQLAYLAGSKYGIDRMKILHRLIEAAVLEENDYAIKGFSTTLQVGQAILSEVDLSCKLGYDKKTISALSLLTEYLMAFAPCGMVLAFAIIMGKEIYSVR